MEACGDTSSSDSEQAFSRSSSSSSSTDISDGFGASGPLFKDPLESGELIPLPPLQNHVPTLSQILREVKAKSKTRSNPKKKEPKESSIEAIRRASGASGATLDKQSQDKVLRDDNTKSTKLDKRAGRKRPSVTTKASGPVSKTAKVELDPDDQEIERKRNDSPVNIVYAPSVSDISSDGSEDHKQFRSVEMKRSRVLAAQRKRKMDEREKRRQCNGHNNSNDSSSTSRSPLSSHSASYDSDSTDSEQEAEYTRTDVLKRLFLNKVCNLGSARCTHIQLCTYQGSYINHAVVKFFPKNSPRFDKELDALRRLRHKNLMRMIDARSFSDQQVLVLRYCNMGNLASHIGRLTLGNIVNHLYKLSSALHYMHDRNFVHGDIKLENVLLDMIFEPVLSDFDLSERLSPGENLIRGRRGTEGFIAPEMYDDPKGFYNGYKVTCNLEYIAI
ncbi:hypothetical protein EGW08_002339 [Elysia chlorotica]|uniref:Protein kinase domain-containing protein n=1 Tax=Elysia chlorotica TaxID=188477 RepID=A0A3S1BVQ5_ELYCH|nr:hypothetical protein EGW08_002339 [Elysia chlorotica]